jgi:glycerophosphoryl diester phosphodiesterase
VKGLSISLLILIILYVLFILSFGGYGKKTATFGLPGSKNKSFFFAHRALSLYYPESSIEAVKAAKQRGLDGVELDIMKDRNGELIVFHDQEDCQRLLGFTGRIDTMTLAEIKKYPLIFGEKIKSSSHVMSLDELAESGYKDSLLFYFDMKLTDLKTADDMISFIKKNKIEKNCLVANSSFSFVFYIEYKSPEINTVLEGFDAGKEWTYYLMPKSLKPDFFSGFSWNLDQSHVNWLKKNDLLDSRIVYGVGLENLPVMQSYGLKNLILDYDTLMEPLIRSHKI